MDYSLTQLFVIAVGYLLLLFTAAWITDRGWLPARFVRHPAVYVFSLGVYASAWATYGSVGYASEYGYNFLAYFLGISGVFLLAPILLAPILRLTTTYQLSSLADLFAFRYRSRVAGTLTTLMMLAATLPLLALQIKAVAGSIQILSGHHNPDLMAFWFCLVITVFAILFGARHATAREKHEGLVVAIALESVIKVAAFAGVGLLALFGVFDGPLDLSRWLNEHPEMLERLYAPLQDGTWHSLILAFFVSAVVMPHMFHMAFTENLNPRALLSASWGVPLLLFIMALWVPVILWAALAEGVTTTPDYFSLGIGLATDGRGAILGYLAGLAGASGILIVATLALSSMCLNHLVLPGRRLHYGENLYRWLLWLRRLLIVGVLALAYAFYSATANESLSGLGVLAFVATLQFVPGLIGALFWPGGNRNGLFAGLIAGFTIWALALLLPLIEPAWHPETLLDKAGLLQPDPAQQWHNIAAASILANTLLFALVSLFTRTRETEINAAETCAVDSLRRPYRWELESETVDDFIGSLTEALGPVTAEREVELALGDLELNRTETSPYALRRLRDQLETNLSGLLGPSVAHQLVDEYLPYKPQGEEGSSEDIQFIETRLEQYRNRLSGLSAELDSLRRFHRQTLLELPMGVVSLGADGEIIGWNQAMEALTGISGERMVGSRLTALASPWRELFLEFVHGDKRHDPQRRLDLADQTRWLSLHRSRVQGALPGERAGGQVLVVEDVTELRSMEDRLAHNERLASIGRLAAGVAHEIGNPVTAIACLAQNLEDDDDTEPRETGAQILAQTQRISRIVESLVTFSHSGGADQELVLEPVRVSDIVQEALELLSLDPDHKQQAFRNECDSGHRVRGDTQRLVQAFVNLLGNAADASANDEAVIVSSRAGTESVHITVEDRGSGLAADVRETLFEPFVTSKAPGSGTGLGLAMVYSIIEEHDGSIRADSPIDGSRGTRFVIELPAFTGQGE
jgi:PAS domain S-box-containing protein